MMPNPFGLKAGSTPSSDMADYFVTLHAVPSPHPALKNYSGSWTPDAGLTEIWGISERFDDPYGLAALSLYDRLKRQLTSVYGPYNEVEFLESGSIWTEQKEFVRSLAAKERCHVAVWDGETGSRLDSGITSIRLSLWAASDEECEVRVMYAFREDSDGPGDDVGLGSL